MQLTLYTDYSLRVLVYLSAHPDQASTISEVSDYYQVSKNHLVKVVHNLASLGYIHSFRGKGGGIKLAHQPESISIGEVVRKVEPNFNIVECFSKSSSQTCTIISICSLKMALHDAGQKFLEVLDGYTLADAISKPLDTDFPLNFHKISAEKK